jgi:surfeit locus 1 family protein
VAQPVTLPEAPDAQTDSYLPVVVTGQFDDTFLRVLVSEKERGAGYRIIAPMTRVDGTNSGDPARRVMVDLGFVTTDQDALSLDTVQPAVVIGNLQWPQEVDGFTPAPDRTNNIWYARDVPAMAQALDTDPVLVVARDVDIPQPGAPMPVDTTRIPNNHLQYAITWFSLAAVWLAMSAYFLRRRSAPQES